jgi:hypothetical protein
MLDSFPLRATRKKERKKKRSEPLVLTYKGRKDALGSVISRKASFHNL